MVRRLAVAIVIAGALAACDSYVERIEVVDDGSVQLRARALIVCDDPLQQEIWGQSPCDLASVAALGGNVAPPPVLTFDPTGFVVAVDGERRQTVDLSWDGEVSELESGIVADAEIRTIDETTTELVLRPGGAPIPEFVSRPDGRRLVSAARWPDAELHVVAPAVVTAHNGDEINGRTVEWRIDGGQADELFVRWSVDGPPRQLWWWLVISIVFTGVLMLIVVLEGSRGRDDDRRQVRPDHGTSRDGG